MEFSVTTYASRSPTQVADRGDHHLIVPVKEFQLPEIVKLCVDDMKTNSNTAAVTSALFANVAVSLITQVMKKDRTTTQEFLGLFVFCSILVNLICCSLSALDSFLLSDFPLQAARLMFSDTDSLAHKAILGDQSLSKDMIEDPTKLLSQFGMNRTFEATNKWVKWTLLLGNALTFTTLMIWVWVELSHTIAGTSMLFCVPYGFVLVYTLLRFLITK